MSIVYKRAGLQDMALLTQTRLTVLRAANGLTDDADMTTVCELTREYYLKALVDGTHTAYIVFDGEKFIGAGGVSYYCVMPTYHNPDGRKAYIMNMYTSPEYRGRGIARETLRLLVKDARERGVTFISLETTGMGRPLYERFGFTAMKNEMQLTDG